MAEFQGLHMEECKEEDFTVHPVTFVLYCTVLYKTVSVGEHRINLLLSGAHSLKERFELHESLLVLWLAQLLHESLGLLLGELLSEVCKETEELVSNHGVVSIFV